MTRINAGIDPVQLCRQHLLAEHREIKRVPNQVKKGRCNLENVPDKFTLGKGHVSFFYDKLGYLLKRYKELFEECQNRGYSVQDYSDAWDGVPPELMGEYEPTEEDKRIILERIQERLNGRQEEKP